MRPTKRQNELKTRKGAEIISLAHYRAAKIRAKVQGDPWLKAWKKRQDGKPSI